MVNTLTHGVQPPETLYAWQQALAEVPQTPLLTSELVQRRADLLGGFTGWYQRLRRRPRAERRRLQRRLGLNLAGIALLMAVNGAPAGAAGPGVTITVSNGTSTVASGDGCSLPEAIINANANNQSGSTDCAGGSGADTISLGTNVTLTVVNNTTISGANGLPVITSPITIEGNGQAISRQVGSPDFRILTVNSSGNLTLNSATISGGSNPGDGGGGGIFNQGTLTVENSTISGNSVDSARGGGINNYGTMTMQNSTLSGNSAGVRGGGIQNWGTLTVSNSTLSGNSATIVGGGIANAGTLTMQNSTLSGNSAGSGGGISNQSTVTVSHSTLSGGSASSGGGGIHNISNAVTVQNSIVAMQAAGAADCSISSGTLTSLGYNIESATSCGFNQTGDLQNVSSGSLALGALANNGGPTQTRALGAGSVAIDHIPVGALEANGCGVTVTTDQRGLPRANGATAGGSACDVGAYEEQSPPLAVTLASFAAQAIHSGTLSDHILLTWETVSEVDNAGFNLYRSASAAPGELLAYVPSQAPGSTQGASYSFEDDQVTPGQTMFYWLEDIDLRGATTLHGPASATIQAPTAVTLAAMEAQAASPGGNVSAWGALVAGLIGVAGVLGARRRSRAG